MSKIKFIDMSDDCPVVGCKRKKSKGGLCKQHAKEISEGATLQHYLGGYIKKKEEHLLAAERIIAKKEVSHG
jgi:hypothetical protein